MIDARREGRRRTTRTQEARVIRWEERALEGEERFSFGHYHRGAKGERRRLAPPTRTPARLSVRPSDRPTRLSPTAMLSWSGDITLAPLLLCLLVLGAAGVDESGELIIPRGTRLLSRPVPWRAGKEEGLGWASRGQGQEGGGGRCNETRRDAPPRATI